jgi:hypothetical protein
VDAETPHIAVVTTRLYFILRTEIGMKRVVDSPDSVDVLGPYSHGTTNGNVLFTECKENAPGFNPTTRDTNH